MVDAKTHSGSLEVRRSGGWFSRQTERLFIRGRDQTDLRLGVTKQVAAVRAELALKVPTYEPDGPNDASPRAIAAPHRQRPGRRQQRDLAERAER